MTNLLAADGVVEEFADEAPKLDEGVHEVLDDFPDDRGGVSGDTLGDFVFEGGLIAVLRLGCGVGHIYDIIYGRC